MFPQQKDENANPAERVARSVMEFELDREGHLPRHVTVILSHQTVVITLEGALSLIEQSLARNADGAAHVEDFHRHLFTRPPMELWKKICEITNQPESGEDSGEEAPPNTCVRVFANGTVVHVLLLKNPVPTSAWSGSWSPRATVELSV